MSRHDYVVHIDVGIGERRRGWREVARADCWGDRRGFGEHNAIWLRRDGGGRCILELVWGRIEARVGTKMVRKVGDGLCGRAKQWGAVGPTHWQFEGERHERRFSWSCGEDYPELWNVARGDVDAVEAVRQINLGEVHRALGWVRRVHSAENPRQGMAKLHRARGGGRDGVPIDVRKGVVDNGPGTSLALRNTAHGAELQIGQMLDGAVGQDRPVPKADHVRHLVLKEVAIRLSGSVAAP